MSVYLDCNATTPVDPEVFNSMLEFFTTEYGNPGSRTHEYGSRARKAVEDARNEIISALKLKVGDRVIFTSGATESNNQVLFGMEDYSHETGKNRIIISGIEHKSILEPAKVLKRRGFDVIKLKTEKNGTVCLSHLKEVLNDKTCLVSIMHVNNETSVIQPLPDVCEILKDSSAFLHTDSAQGFGKEIEMLNNPRIDMISFSGHKIYGPKGIGALVLRRRGYNKIPLTPILYGGGQEDGYRSGTLAVPLIVGLGKAVSIAYRDHSIREQKCLDFKKNVLAFIRKIGGTINGDCKLTTCAGINFSIPNVDSEAAMLALKGTIAISNGSACTSQNYTPSYVLTEMGLKNEIIRGALRLSWSHLTPDVNWETVYSKLKPFLKTGE